MSHVNLQLHFLIKRNLFATTFGNTCLDARGGYSIKIKFWWHIQVPDKIVRLALRHLSDNRDKNLISINVLEFVIKVVNYCGALLLITTKRFTSDPRPVLLNLVNNILANLWTTHTCKSLHLGKLLAKFLCYLLLDENLGFNSSWISTTDNYISNKISRLKKLQSISSQHFFLGYYSLRQKYPQLKTFVSFVPLHIFYQCCRKYCCTRRYHFSDKSEN